MMLKDIMEFNDPEKQEELEKLYGPTISSWEDVGCWDDCVIKEQKALISDFESENPKKEQCPYLKKLDNYFYFCKKRADTLNKMGIRYTEKPEIHSCQYKSNIDHFSLQLWCMQPEEKYSRCISSKNY